jgi:hypothetical protein
VISPLLALKQPISGGQRVDVGVWWEGEEHFREEPRGYLGGRSTLMNHMISRLRRSSDSLSIPFLDTSSPFKVIFGEGFSIQKISVAFKNARETCLPWIGRRKQGWGEVKIDEHGSVSIFFISSSGRTPSDPEGWIEEKAQ